MDGEAKIQLIRKMVMLHTKKNDACSNILANILPADIPSTPGMGSKVKTFFESTVVVCHIKLKGLSRA